LALGLLREVLAPQTKTTAAMRQVLVAAAAVLATMAAKVETDYTEVVAAAHPVTQQFALEAMVDLAQLFWNLLGPRQVT
jgi:hypothetical protein